MNPNMVEPDIAAALAEEAKNAAGEASNKLKVNVGGQELEFDNVEQIGAAFAAITQRANDEVRSREAALAEARAQAGRNQYQAPPPVREEDEPLNKEKFAKLLTEDTGAAMDYAFKKTDTYKEMQRQIVGQNQQQAAQVAQMEYYKFLDSNKDFPAEDVNTRQTLGNIIQQGNLPFTAQGLQMAWDFAARRGILQPRNVEAFPNAGGGDPTPQYQPPQNLYQMPQPQNRQAPPTLRRGGQTAPTPASWEQAAEGMSAEKLKELINRHDPMLGVR